MPTPVLHVIVGPNRAGKSTFQRSVLAASTLEFVNANHIAARLWPGADEERSYDAARLAGQRRIESLAEREGYDYAEHGKAGNVHADFVPDEVIERFCILGDANHHIAQLRDWGVNQFAIYLMHDAQNETLNAYGQRIIPALAA